MNKQLLFLSLVLALLLFSCKGKEKASRKPLDGKNVDYLLNQLTNNEFQFNTLSVKAGFNVSSEGKSTGFKATLRIRKDSAIWMSITPALGIELARVLITQDSVKVINRLQKEYFIGDYEYINNKFNLELVYDDLQSVLLGNSIAFKKKEKLKFAIDNDMYYLGNMAKRRAKKADNKPQKIERKKDEVVSLWLNDSTFKINKFLLSDLTADRFIRGVYSDHQNVEEQLLPHLLKFYIQSIQPTELEIEYSRVSLNKPISFSFNISSKYEQVFY